MEVCSQPHCLPEQRNVFKDKLRNLLEMAVIQESHSDSLIEHSFCVDLAEWGLFLINPRFDQGLMADSLISNI